MKIIKKMGWLFAFLFIGIIFWGILKNMQEKLIFFPEVLPQDHQFIFEQPFEEIYFDVDKGVKINALHFKADSSKGVVIYFHGNAGSLDGWGHTAGDFTNNGYDLMIFDYRGYGKSTGKIKSEASLHNDASFIYKQLLKETPEKDIVIYGRSIGTGIATKLASENAPKMLILETPLYSLLDLAKHYIPFIPHKWVLKYKLQTNTWITKVQCPIHIFHGTADNVVPYNASVRLLKLLENKNLTSETQSDISQGVLTTIEGGNHNDLSTFPQYQEKLKLLLN